MTERVTFPAASGEASGVWMAPDGQDRRPAVIVIHEWWGVNDQIQSIAKKWQAAGFIALVPDLYHGKVVPIDKPDQAEAAMKQLDFGRAVQELAGAAAFLKSHARCNGKVSVTGYCMGGALALAVACTVPGLASVVPFYGLPPGGDWSKVDAPILGHYAKTDEWATPAGAKQIQEALAKHHRKMEVHVYDAKHAFCNDQRPDVYDAAACAQAWQRTLAFVRDHSA